MIFINKIKPVLVFLLVIQCFVSPIRASQPYYNNIGFEKGNFSNWKGYTWIFDTYPGSVSTPKVEGIIPGRHTIISDTTAYDIKTGGKLKKIPPGYKYSARLGDAVTGALFESLSYTLKVDSTNALLIYKFAVVLQDPLYYHLKFEEPRFGVTIFDQNGDTIPDCANYDVHVSDAKITGFQTNKNDTLPIVWRDWTTVGANLLPYFGKTINIEFMAGDCSREGHYGYAYFVADTQPLTISSKYCTSDSVATLTAPDGFEKYIWENDKNIVVGTNRVIQVKNPNEGDVFSCKMTSATGCTVSLNTKVVRYESPKVDFTSSLLDCVSNSVQFSNLSSSTEGTLEYKWDFGDGKISVEQNPIHTFSTSGMHQVSLEVLSSVHSCSSTLSKSVESFSSRLVGLVADSAYCKGAPTLITAYGADNYTWSNGSTSKSINVPAPGGKIWMVGHSSTGCISDTIFHTVYETPDWPFSVNGELSFCAGQSTVLNATDAVSYYWNTGENTKSITVKTPGVYTVKGVNEHNCEKSISVNVKENQLPLVDFILSSTSVDSRRNKLTCTIPEETGVKYVWDMGDGFSGTGNSIEHAYDISQSTLEYIITLTATNINTGCTNTISKTIDVDLFIPNIFTPNGDSKNDEFMKGYDIQIFDRSGIIIYKGMDGWDGTYNGKVMDNDTYFYLIRYTDKNQRTQILKGFVTLKK